MIALIIYGLIGLIAGVIVAREMWEDVTESTANIFTFIFFLIMLWPLFGCVWLCFYLDAKRGVKGCR